MAKYSIEDSTLIAIGDAIREKNDTTESMTPAEMAEAISAIETGGDSSAANTLSKMIDRTIVEISDAKVTVVAGFAFRNCFSLVTADFPNVTEIESYAFNNCSKLANVNFPKVTSVNKNAFQSCSVLATVDLPKATSIAADAFSSCSKLATLILRNTTRVVSLGNTSALSGTAIKSGTGYVYVPDDRVDSYKAATNWSTYAAQIKPLSELEETV